MAEDPRAPCTLEEKIQARWTFFIQNFHTDVASIMDYLVEKKVFFVGTDPYQQIMLPNGENQQMRMLLRKLPHREDARKHFLCAIERSATFIGKPDVYLELFAAPAEGHAAHNTLVPSDWREEPAVVDGVEHNEEEEGGNSEESDPRPRQPAARTSTPVAETGALPRTSLDYHGMSRQWSSQGTDDPKWTHMDTIGTASRSQQPHQDPHNTEYHDPGAHLVSPRTPSQPLYKTTVSVQATEPHPGAVQDTEPRGGPGDIPDLSEFLPWIVGVVLVGVGVLVLWRLRR